VVPENHPRGRAFEKRGTSVERKEDFGNEMKGSGGRRKRGSRMGVGEGEK